VAARSSAAPRPSDPPRPPAEPRRDATPARTPVPREAADARPARLVDHREVDADAVFSPSFATNGTAVFFHAESGDGSALKRADADGGELRVASIVDDGARNYHVQLSPDGRQVAFDSDRDGVRGVYVADARGHGVQRVSGPGYAAVPTWSPDGRRLAFIRGEDARPSVWNLWLLDRASGRQARVTSFARGQVWGGAWFADGQRLAYSHEDRLILHDLSTGRSRAIASPVPGRMVRTPAVSPDGRWVVFQVHRDGVWLFDVEHGGMQRVLDDASAEEFAWSPDGRRVAYHSRRSGGWNLWTMAVP
jgi:TolB protein